MTRRRMVLLLAVAVLPAAAQRGRGRPPASAEKIEITGTIERVQIVPGEGMPFLEVRDRDGLHKVFLGSMRYLIEQDFRPKAGTEAFVRGFKVSDGILAIRVEIPSTKTTIQLRDEDGMPVWRGGPRRRAQQ